MPLYHFDVHTSTVARDLDGIEFPDLAAAKVSAIAGARFLAAEDMKRDSRFNPHHSIAIRDADGLLLHATRFGDCVDVRL
jgi:hypothetical protein